MIFSSFAFATLVSSPFQNGKGDDSQFMDRVNSGVTTPTAVGDWRGFEDVDAQNRPKRWKFFEANGTPWQVLPTVRPLPRNIGEQIPVEPFTLGGGFWVAPWIQLLNKTGFRSGGDGNKYYSTGWSTSFAYSAFKSPINDGRSPFAQPNDGIKAWAFSEPIALDNERLLLLLGGNREETNLQVEVWVEGEASTLPVGTHGANLPGYGLVHRFLGTNVEQMQWQSWTVPVGMRNKKAVIWINDSSTTGHLNVDAIRLAKAAVALNTDGLDVLGGARTGLLGNSAPPIFGWADLHAHPMNSMSCGGKFVWGSQGGGYVAGVANEEAAYARDLTSCDGGGHGANGLENWISQATKGQTIRALVYEKFSLGKHAHGPGGYPTFGNWPHPFDPNHQQMHVNQIRRAYEGGQRLMVAAMLENQVAKYFLETGFRHNGAARYVTDPNVEFTECMKQVAEMKRFVGQNTSWMGIATTPAEARQLASQNKMIIVLAVETDQLSTVEHFKQLHDVGVRVFTITHLIDNNFGGSAAYNPLFNAMNFLCRGNFFGVTEGNTPEFGVKFRFEREDLLALQTTASIPTGTAPTDFTRRVWDAGYQPHSSHVNQLGLTAMGRTVIKELASRGAIIDLAHMSHRAVEDTLQETKRISPGNPTGYPVTFTHGGVRTPGAPHADERALHPSHLAAMYAGKGVFGVGTSGGSSSLISTLRTLRGASKDIGVSLGSDFNGGDMNAGPNTQVPREYVSYMNGATRHPQGVPFTLPLAQQRGSVTRRPLVPSGAGRRWFNFNTDGLAHYGLLPDLLEEASLNGASAQDMALVLGGAESFVQMWERCEGLKRTIR